MSIFFEVGHYIVETSEIITGVCVSKYKDGATSYIRDTEYFEVSFHIVTDSIGHKKVTQYYHVYSSVDELPLEYKLHTLRKLLREASMKNEKSAAQILNIIKEEYFRSNDSFDSSKKLYITNNKL